MKAAVEHSGEKKPTSELTTVPAYVVGPLYDALEANDRDAINDFFYNQCNRVVEYINSLPPMSRLSKVLQLMHDQIDVLAGAGSSDAEWATTRLSADALFQTCLGPMPANDAPWGIVDLVGHASMQASDAASDILLPIVAQKLTESPTDVLLEADTRAPLGVHLLRMRALAQIGMYQDSSWSVVEPVLERYSNMESPLFAMVAQIEKENCQLDRELRANGQDPDALSTKSRELLQRQAQYEQVFCAVDMPPGFDLQKTYVRIASDAVASCAANGDVERFIHLHPGVSTDATVIGRELIVDSSSSYAETDYPFLYSTFTLGAIGDKTGLNITQLSLASQRHLFDFMIESGPERYERLEGALDRLSPAEKLYFTEAFLATEFGDDFGDILLDLAETADSSELHRAVELIADVRKAGREIAEQFVSEEPLDRLIAERMPTAFAKRVTELLALARQDGISEVMESLEAVAGASGEIAKSLASGVFTQVDMAADFGSFGAEGAPVTITARPSGNNARLGFTVRGMGASGKERLNIRLDYEDGRLSLDIGSGAKKGVNSSDIARKVGADLARGELALAIYRDTESALHGNHIREMFEDLPDIYPDEFAGVVNRFMYRLKLSGPTDLQKAA